MIGSSLTKNTVETEKRGLRAVESREEAGVVTGPIQSEGCDFVSRGFSVHL